MEKCPITDLASEVVDSNSYKIKVNNEYLFIKYGITFEELVKQEKFKKNKHLLAGAIINKQLSDREDIYWFSITQDELEEKLKKIIYPKTPQAKLDNLFKSLYLMQEYDGEKIRINRKVSEPEFYYKHFLKSEKECNYFVEELNYQGLIDCKFQDITNHPIEYNITFQGLNFFLELVEKGELSNKCLD